MQIEPSRRPRVTLVLGGARSGKSRYAQQLAEQLEVTLPGARILFLATAHPLNGEPLDEEMLAKIARHQQDRPAHWQTLEEPLALTRALTQKSLTHDLILIDCLTFYASNLLHAHCQPNEEKIDAELKQLTQALSHPTCHIVLVSNEVGSGVVPAHELGRQYRDLLGQVNQRVAAAATDVVLLVAGLPLTIKAG